MMAPLLANKKALGAAASLLTAAGGIFANEKYAITSDIKQISRKRNYLVRYGARIAQLGAHATTYGLVQVAKAENQMLWFEGRTWTYAQAKAEIDRISTVLHDKSIGPGDVVAVFMTNSPEMVFTYLALARLGAVVAMINTALRKETLAHCVDIANAKQIVCTPDLLPAVVDLLVMTKSAVPCLIVSLSSFPSSNEPIDHLAAGQVSHLRYEDLAAISSIRPSTPARRGPMDVGVLLYTSGSTGKPKAVVMRNIWTLITSVAESEDYENPRKYFPLRVYSCLPLFHATGFIAGLIGVLGTSSTLCLARKFSATRFSRDLTESQATRMLYVGELCRYLLKADPSTYDRAHRCIVANGNGLKGDVWNKFRARFNIPEIREFYRSTEGIAMFSAISSRGKDAGYVGRMGPLQRWLETTTYLVKYDFTTEAPWRDPKTGLCRPVASNEPGEAIGRVLSMAMYREYLNNPAADEKKLIKDVFQKGDLYQRTGDLFIRDSSGRIRFADRLGDTYRWQGENVSAGEVRDHIGRLANVHDAVVYGVSLAGYDGQAGAAGISLTDGSPQATTTFIEGLYQRMRSRGLTRYQIPRLVRLTEQIDTTATFKHVKATLQARTWDPEQQETKTSTAVVDGQTAGDGRPGQDKLYWLDGDHYRILDIDSWRRIATGEARL